MTPYLSYWSKGYRKLPSKYIIDLHKLAAFLCKKAYGEIHFITDTVSEKYFKDIKFDSVTVLKELDDIEDGYSVTWSLGKLVCFRYLAERKIHFMHLDYDVFLWGKLPSFIENSDVFAQHVEENVYNYYNVEEMLLACKYKNFAEENLANYAFNMGIFGGKDSSFIENYSKSSIELVMNPENRKFWAYGPDEINIYGNGWGWGRAVLAEQWFLANYAQQNNKVVTSLFDSLKDINEKAREYNYTHLWGSKSSPEIIEKIYKRIGEFNL